MDDRGHRDGPFELVDELTRTGRTRVRFPVGSADVRTAAEDVLRFFALPAQEKSHWSHRYRLGAGSRESEAGYMRRDRHGDDDKEFFHYNPVFEQVAGARIERAEASHPVRAAVGGCRTLYRASMDCLRGIVARLERERPELARLLLSPGVDPRLTLRVVKYRVRTGATHLARPHYDRSALTLAIAESGPGLRVGLGEHDLRPVISRAGSVLVMAGRQQEVLPPAWHDVVLDPIAADAPGTDGVRWAVVAFANDPGRRSVVGSAETNAPLRRGPRLSG